jgi:hypothetical protein
MLPFLSKPKASGGVITEIRPSDYEKDDHSDGLEACAKDLCHSIEMKDYKKIAAALKAAFDILESLPHEEAHEASEEK